MTLRSQTKRLCRALIVTINEKKAPMHITPAAAERAFMRKRKKVAGLKTEAKVEKKGLGTHETTWITMFFLEEPT